MGSDECGPLSVSRRIDVPAPAIFKLLADPNRHPEFDGSEMLRPGSSNKVIVGTGDVFTKGRDFAAWLGLVPKQISTGDRTILGKISRRGNRYLRVLFVQAAWVVLIKPKTWERHGLKPWIEAAKKRLHRNVLAIALANKLARIAWSVLARGRAFEVRKVDEAAAQPA